MPTKAKIRVFKKPDWRPSKTHVAQPVTTPTMHKSQSVAKLDWRTPQDNGFVSPYSDGPEMSKDSRNIDSSHYSQSSSNGRNVTYKNDYDTLVDSTSIWPKAQTVQNMDWSTPQNNGHVSSYNSGSGISKDSWNIDSSHYFPSSSNGRNVRYKNEYDVLADSAKWSTSHDNDYISSYSSGFDIPELTRRIDSSRQAQTSSNARVAAPTNDHDMLVNSALWPKLHISETAQWTITRREIEIAAQSWKVVDSLQAQTFSHTRGRPRKRDYDILGDSPLTWLPPQTIDNSQQTTSSKRRKFSWDGRKVANSRQAQRSSNVGEAAHVNDQDMLGDSLQSMPKDFVLNSQGTYREWLAPFSYP